MYFDTEFIDTSNSLELISLAFVKENQEAYYAVSSEFDESKASPWVQQHVINQLEPPSTRKPLLVIKKELSAFIGYQLPELWAYFGAFDWVLMVWLYGGFERMPYNFPFYYKELRQEMERIRFPEGNFPPNPAPHHARSDALWAWELHQEIQKFQQKNIQNIQ